MTIALDQESPGLVPPPWAPDCWGEQDQTELVCRTILEITHDVKTFMFEPVGDKVFHFEPGQFITLQLEIDGQPISRCYTISSPPTRPHLIAITVKRVIGGPVSNWLHDNVTPGTRITVLAPLGQFTLSGPPAPKYLFLSAGSGITPVMSMTRTLFDLGSDADILFVHSRTHAGRHHLPPGTRGDRRGDAEHPGRAHLRERLPLRALDGAARPSHHCRAPGDRPGPVRTGDLHLRAGRVHGRGPPRPRRGRLRHGQLPRGELLLREPARRPSRPPPIRCTRRTRTGDTEAPTADAGVATFSVEFVRSGRTINIAANQYVLDAALAAGLRPPVLVQPGHVRHLQDHHAGRARSTCSTTAESGPRRSRTTRS